MKKEEVVQHLLTKVEGVTRKQISSILDEYQALVEDQLFECGEMTVLRIGRLHASRQEARTGRNPSTGETLEIPAKLKFKMKIFKRFKTEVNKRKDKCN